MLHLADLAATYSPVS